MQSPADVLMVWPYMDDYTPKRHMCLSGPCVLGRGEVSSSKNAISPAPTSAPAPLANETSGGARGGCIPGCRASSSTIKYSARTDHRRARAKTKPPPAAAFPRDSPTRDSTHAVHRWRRTTREHRPRHCAGAQVGLPGGKQPAQWRGTVAARARLPVSHHIGQCRRPRPKEKPPAS